MRAQFALADPCHDSLGCAPRVVRKALYPGTEEDADNRIVLEQRQIHGERRNLAARESDRHQPAIPTHEPGQSGEERTANIVDADVETFVAGEGLHTLTYVFARIVDDLLSALLADNGRLRGGTHGCNDACPKQMRELNASQANPAGGS